MNAMIALVQYSETVRQFSTSIRVAGINIKLHVTRRGGQETSRSGKQQELDSSQSRPSARSALSSERRSVHQNRTASGLSLVRIYSLGSTLKRFLPCLTTPTTPYHDVQAVIREDLGVDIHEL